MTNLTFPTRTVPKGNPLYRTQMIGRAQDLFVRNTSVTNYNMNEVLAFAKKAKLVRQYAGKPVYTHYFLKNFSKPLASR